MKVKYLLPVSLQVLFELARFHAPSTIFLDELDAIMGQRGSTGNSRLLHRII